MAAVVAARMISELCMPQDAIAHAMVARSAAGMASVRPEASRARVRMRLGLD